MFCMWRWPQPWSKPLHVLHGQVRTRMIQRFRKGEIAKNLSKKGP